MKTITEREEFESNCVADSGQKQLIYRLDAQVIQSENTPYLVQFETEQVLINAEFWKQLGIADRDRESRRTWRGPLAVGARVLWRHIEQNG